VALFFTSALMSCSSCKTSAPSGEVGESADALAHQMQAAVNIGAWNETGAVSWSFRGKRRHLWDRERGLARFQPDDETTILFDIARKRGVVKKGDVILRGEDAQKDVDAAYAAFINDAFWLNPTATLFNPEVSRAIVDVDGQRGLKIQFGAGGVTPGDSYVFIVDKDGLPTAYRMWVQVLPVPGAEAKFENWVELSTGARIATHYPLAVGAVEIGDPKGAKTLRELVGDEDPFALLLEGEEPGPASQPAVVE